MNFISTFDELNKLYEAVEPADDAVEEGTIDEAYSAEELTEDADDEEIEIVDGDTLADEIGVEESSAEEESKQLLIECDKCGALVIKDEADIVSDEESGLVNLEDKCTFCEETAGYKIVGIVIPYEADDMEIPVEDDSEIDDAPAADDAEELPEEELAD